MMLDVPESLAVGVSPLADAVALAVVSVPVLVDFVHRWQIKHSDYALIASCEDNLGVGVVRACY